MIRMRDARWNLYHPLDSEETSSENLVGFDADLDPYRPRNWPWRKKITTVMLYATTTTTSTFSSSVFSTAIVPISEAFHVSTVVATLGISLFLVGFGVGPLLWAPLSELYGRKLSVLVPVFVGGCFAFGGGAAKDLQTIMICRFFQGLFSSAPISNAGGVLADLYQADKRGAAMALYTVSNVGGPMVGPLIGGALCINKSLGWRWTQYISGIWAVTQVVVGLIMLDETHEGTLLKWKAQDLRRRGNWALHANHEEAKFTASDLARTYLIRPPKILATPIGILMATYQAFAFGTLYASLSAIPIIFQEVRGWNEVVGALPFLAMLLGIVIGASATYFNQPFYMKRLKQNGGKPAPEARLPPVMLGSVFFTGGLFMLAWSSSRAVFWLVPNIGLVFVGFGFLTVMNSANSYVVDTFQQVAASALAANILWRSAFAVAFPLFTSQMLHALGVGWGVSIFGFVAAAMMPIPFVLYRFGARIRAKSVGFALG
ncbi:hypothetical protein M409DRAFT_70378 [Zasmidium cellare ATCC 36951]|uniref:Cercosporin MFS transporter CTB4 n=1 Tax=Zasmidium cellare ATCC 36951 TaxID=1080233 RepID=A0A6A6C5I6_ZASCE|nr:uncharacterized protein M409DRAFT_70378 [Zasmidium cellare ATCC 36951]KAF2160646.1 hypothetical protein M409DRAFT_70378 [Zasmidium cellare ATCC 36951]